MLQAARTTPGLFFLSKGGALSIYLAATGGTNVRHSNNNLWEPRSKACRGTGMRETDRDRQVEGKRHGDAVEAGDCGERGMEEKN